MLPRILSICLPFVFTQIRGLEHTGMTEPGATLQICSGDNAEFDWGYKLGPGERVIQVEVIHHHKEGDARKIKEGSTRPYLQHSTLTGTNLTVTSARQTDAGRYTHTVLLNTGKNYSIHANLEVFEVPRVKTDSGLPELEISETVEWSSQTKSWFVAAFCGTFAPLGYPLPKAYLKTPNKKQLEPIKQANGKFVFALGSNATTGLYTCELAIPAVAAKCVDGTPALLRSKDVRVDTGHIRFLIMGMQIHSLRIDLQRETQGRSNDVNVLRESLRNALDALRQELRSTGNQPTNYTQDKQIQALTEALQQERRDREKGMQEQKRLTQEYMEMVRQVTTQNELGRKNLTAAVMQDISSLRLVAEVQNNKTDSLQTLLHSLNTTHIYEVKHLNNQLTTMKDSQFEAAREMRLKVRYMEINYTQEISDLRKQLRKLEELLNEEPTSNDTELAQFGLRLSSLEDAVEKLDLTAQTANYSVKFTHTQQITDLVLSVESLKEKLAFYEDALKAQSHNLTCTCNGQMAVFHNRLRALEEIDRNNNTGVSRSSMEDLKSNFTRQISDLQKRLSATEGSHIQSSLHELQTRFTERTTNLDQRLAAVEGVQANSTRVLRIEMRNVTTQCANYLRTFDQRIKNIEEVGEVKTEPLQKEINALKITHALDIARIKDKIKDVEEEQALKTKRMQSMMYHLDSNHTHEIALLRSRLRLAEGSNTHTAKELQSALTDLHSKRTRELETLHKMLKEHEANEAHKAEVLQSKMQQTNLHCTREITEMRKRLKEEEDARAAAMADLLSQFNVVKSQQVQELKAIGERLRQLEGSNVAIDHDQKANVAAIPDKEIPDAYENVQHKIVVNATLEKQPVSSRTYTAFKRVAHH